MTLPPFTSTKEKEKTPWTNRRYRIRGYVVGKTEGRINWEDTIEVDDTITTLSKEVAQRTCDSLIDRHLTGEDVSRLFRNFFKTHQSCDIVKNWKVTSIKELPLSKYEVLVRAVNVVMRQYDEPLTLRQLYYRLVAKMIIPNTINEYKGLSRHLVKARETGVVDYKKIEDRTRSTIGGDSDYESKEEYLEYRVRQFMRSFKYFDLTMWANQETFVEVWVEKDALSRTVSSVSRRYNVRTCPSKGYPSFSYVKDAAKRLQYLEQEKIVIVYLGDHDPSGKDIPRDLEARLIRYGVPYDKLIVDCVALTVEQIEEHNLPPAPAKRSDARFAKFIAETGSDDVVELDALEPPILQAIVKKAIEGYIDTDLWNERLEEIETQREELKEMLQETELDIPDFDYRFPWEDEEE